MERIYNNINKTNNELRSKKGRQILGEIALPCNLSVGFQDLWLELQ